MGFLVAEKRNLVCATDNVSLGRCILAGLMRGSQKGLVDTLPQGTQLKAFYVTGDGTAYVDFNEVLGSNLPGGVRSELFAVFSIVNSLTLNLPDVNRVQILIDGRQKETLAGHVAISDPFKANILLIK
jgi:spore germination protein GerM